MKNLNKLSDVEMEIMKVMWNSPEPLTVIQLLNLFKEKEWKNSTMSTLLSRLISKGYLQKQNIGKSNLYSPIITLTEYKNYATKKFVKRIHAGDVRSFIASLIDDNEITSEDIIELKNWFSDKIGE